MYCQNCGNELLEGRNFCQHCGVQMTNSFNNMAQGDPLLVIKPQFFSLSMFIRIVGWQLLMTLWGAVISGITGFVIIKIFEFNASAWVISLIAGILFFILTPFVYILSNLNKYTNTQFFFYKNMLGCYEGILKADAKNVRYQDILEINLERGFWQKISGIGDIIISTAAIGQREGIARSGIRMFDVLNPDTVFNRIKQIIDEAV